MVTLVVWNVRIWRGSGVIGYYWDEMCREICEKVWEFVVSLNAEAENAKIVGRRCCRFWPWRASYLTFM